MSSKFKQSENFCSNALEIRVSKFTVQFKPKLDKILGT